MVSVCLPSDVVLKHLPSYVGFSYLDLWLLFTVVPAKRSQFSLPWTNYISSLTSLLTLNSSSPSCAHAGIISCMCGISPDYSLEGLTLKLQLQYFVHLMQRTVSLEKILMLGKNEGQGEGDKRGWDREFNGLEFQQVLGVGDGQGIMVCCSPWGCTQSETTEQMKWTNCHRANALNTSS